MRLIQRNVSILLQTFMSHSKVTRATCHQKLIPANVVTAGHRSFHVSSSNDESTRPTPRLLYFQNPFTWLATKLDFGVLKRTWDPQFSEDEFKRGAKQAVAVISKLVSQNRFDDLRGLLTKHAVNTLRREVETEWTDEQRRLISMAASDIQVAVPGRVHFQSVVEQKFCDVDMVFMALKWSNYGKMSAMVLVQLVARFHRNYTEGYIPEWTVSVFHVTRFRIIPH